MPLTKDPIKAEETRKKMREASKKVWEDPEYRQKMVEFHTGKKQSKETIEKRISKIKNKPRSPRIQKNCLFCGKELSLAKWEKNRKFCSAPFKGKWQSKNAIAGINVGNFVDEKCLIVVQPYEFLIVKIGSLKSISTIIIVHGVNVHAAQHTDIRLFHIHLFLQYSPSLNTPNFCFSSSDRISRGNICSEPSLGR